MAVRITDNPKELHAQVQAWRCAGERVIFVPTMGNLHAGHIALVNQAKQIGSRVVVSVFVNPLQFGLDEDFSAYPRTLDEDTRLLQAASADVLFTPALKTLYPRGDETITRIDVPDLTTVLCGVRRPGHFSGVATVVCKLLNIVQPDQAIFGEKDFQQLLVVRKLVSDLDLPVDIIPAPTIREADGLAMSSRNAYLDEAERRVAPELYASLKAVAEAAWKPNPDYPKIERNAMKSLKNKGFEPEYLEIRRSDNLARPDQLAAPLRVFAAAWLGQARLIDNCPVNPD